MQEIWSEKEKTIVDSEEAYKFNLKRIKSISEVKNLTDNQILKLIDLFIYFLENEGLVVVEKDDILTTSKYQEFEKYNLDSNYLTAKITSLEEELDTLTKKLGKTMTKIEKPSKKSNFKIYTETIFTKSLKDFITDINLPTYRIITKKDGSIEKTIISRPAKNTESIFQRIFWDYFTTVGEENKTNIDRFYIDLVEATKDYYSTVPYCVTIANYFGNDDQTWYKVYSEYISSKEAKNKTGTQVDKKFDWE